MKSRKSSFTAAPLCVAQKKGAVPCKGSSKVLKIVYKLYGACPPSFIVQPLPAKVALAAEAAAEY